MFERNRRIQRTLHNTTRSIPIYSLHHRSSSTPHQPAQPPPHYTYSIGSIPLFAPTRPTAINSAPDQDKQLGTRIQAAKHSGQPLDSKTQRTLEQGADVDLTHTHIHTDQEADRLAYRINARAFTSGTDIFFRTGQYQPSTVQGLRLLAHEVTHVIQQAQGPVPGTRQPDGITLSDPQDPFEQAAQRRASQFAHRLSSPTYNHAAPQAKTIVPQHTTNSVAVQREIMPVKESLKAPGGSTAVPDLTDAQVQQIQRASSPTDRLTVTVDIVKNLLLAHKILDSPDASYTAAEVISGTTPHTTGLLSIRVAYKQNNTRTALTYHDKDDTTNTESWYQLDVYAPAFQEPSIFYSTIRHELIHVGQRVLTPENWKVQSTDKVKYEVNEQYTPTVDELKAAGYTFRSKKKQNRAKTISLAVGKLNAAHMNELAPETETDLNTRFPTDTDRQLYSLYVGAQTVGPGKIQDGLQEAETYTWELLHIPETNIPPSYVVETMKLLLNYLDQIINIAPSLSILQKSYWEAYVIETAQTIQKNDGSMQALLTSRWSGSSDPAIAETTKFWLLIVQRARDIEQLWVNALAPAKALAATTISTPVTAPVVTAPTGSKKSITSGKYSKNKLHTVISSKIP